MTENKVTGSPKVNKVIEALRKKHDKSVIGLLDSMGLENTNPIPTGSIQLTHKLKGGYPEGAILEIWGLQASGKCVPFSSLIATPNGLLTLEEIFKDNGLPVSSDVREVPLEIPLINRYGDIEMSGGATYNGIRTIYKINTYSGSQIKTTSNHPHLVMSRDGDWEWRDAQDIRSGDYLIRPREIDFFGQTVIPSAEAYSLGVLLAGGELNDGSITIPCTDTIIQSVLSRATEPLIGISPVISANPILNRLDYSFASDEGIQAFYDRVGWGPATAANKVISRFIREMSSATLSSFVQGFMDYLATVTAVGIQVKHNSYQVLSTLKLILQQFGIHCELSEDLNRGYHLLLSLSDTSRYMSKIGFYSREKKESARELRAPNSAAKNVYIPHAQELLRGLILSDDGLTVTHGERLEVYLEAGSRLPLGDLKHILELNWPESSYLTRLQDLATDQYIYDEVTNIDICAAEPTGDVHMPETNSFLLEGIVTHNTLITLHAIAEAQRQDKVAVFIDSEHAFNPQFAAQFGVDPSKLIYVAPDDGDQALSIAQELCETGEVSLIVVDSVSTLVPRAEIDGGMEKQQVGLQARMMSKALRILTPSAKKNKCSIFFINQIREKVGVMFGDPSTTSGGNALKSYASVRIKVKANKSDYIYGEEGKEGGRIGHTMTLEIVKSKVSCPSSNIRFDVYYGGKGPKGIDVYSELLTIGVDRGIIEKSGAFYSYDGNKLGQGAKRAATSIREDDFLREEITAKVQAELDKE